MLIYLLFYIFPVDLVSTHKTYHQCPRRQQLRNYLMLADLKIKLPLKLCLFVSGAVFFCFGFVFAHLGRALSLFHRLVITWRNFTLRLLVFFRTHLILVFILFQGFFLICFIGCFFLAIPRKVIIHPLRESSSP